MAARKTNVQIVRNLMEDSRFGALTQAFVIQAITLYADRVADATPEQLETGLISGKAWHGIALEVKGKLDQHYGRAA